MEFVTNIIKIMSKYWKVFLVTGVGYTLLLSFLAVFFGALLGVLICLCRMSKAKLLSWFAAAFVDIIRGTPMLLQIFVGYFVVPKILPFDVSEFSSVAVAFAINSGCYMSEVFRSGIQAVDKGQTEAARSLGLSARQTMTRIVLPQAVKNVLPALGNEFVTITKDTSLASTFFIGDIMTSYLKVKGATYLTMECLFIVAVIYYVINVILSKLVDATEKRLKTSD